MDNNKEILRQVASSIENFDEWFELDYFAEKLKSSSFDLKSTGNSRLMDYLLQLPDFFKIKLENPKERAPKVLVTFIGKPFIPEDILEEPGLTTSNLDLLNGKTSKDVLNSISENWKLEAKLESKNDYFYHFQEVNSIINGSKYYIIGRKGTGKSSISEYIHK